VFPVLPFDAFNGFWAFSPKRMTNYATNHFAFFRLAPPNRARICGPITNFSHILTRQWMYTSLTPKRKSFLIYNQHAHHPYIQLLHHFNGYARLLSSALPRLIAF